MPAARMTRRVQTPPPFRTVFEAAHGLMTSRGPYNIRNQRRMRDETLRHLANSDTIASLCINLRQRQVWNYTRASEADDRPGMRIRLRDRERKIKGAEKKMAETLLQFLLRTAVPGVLSGNDEFLHDHAAMFVRDMMVLDKSATEVGRNDEGKIVQFRTVDVGTIRRVGEGGFSGEKRDIDPGLVYHPDDKMRKKLAKLRKGMIPAPEDITFVQVLAEGYDQPVNAYTDDDLIYTTLQERSDVHWRGLGLPPLEQAVHVAAGFISAMSFNLAGLNAANPKKAVVLKGPRQLTLQEMASYQEQFRAMFSGPSGQHSIPILQGDAQILDFLGGVRDAEYVTLMEFLGQLEAALLGVDLAELGIKFRSSSKSLSEGGIKDQQQHSRSEGLAHLLSAHAFHLNQILHLMGHEDFEVEYTGLRAEDREQLSKARTEAGKRDTTLNELRAQQDMPSLPWGDFVNEPTALQAYQAHMQQEQGDDYEDFDVGNEVDEAFKAMRPVRSARTLLKGAA